MKTNGKTLKDLIQIDWTLKGLKLHKKINKLIVPGQNIAYSSREDLSEYRELINEAYISGLVGIPEAFCSLF